MKVKVREDLIPMHMTPEYKKIIIAERKTVLPLTEQQKAEVKCNILALRDACPELEDFVKELAKEGMIPGWRAVTINYI